MTFKDKVTNICSLILAISGGLLAASFAASFPNWLKISLGIITVVSGAVIGWASGKDGNMKTKKTTLDQ